MNIAIKLAATALLLALTTCRAVQQAQSDRGVPPPDTVPVAFHNSSRVAHVLVALCDNEHQGIVPVPTRLGTGDDLRGNLYWGAAYGVKTFFSNSPDWKLVARFPDPTADILERCVFRHKNNDAYLVADAYRGAEIKKCINDFLDFAAGGARITAVFKQSGADVTVGCGGSADLIAFVGHNGLMDFNLSHYPTATDSRHRDAIALCCASKGYFGPALRKTGASPLLWTNGLMAPEAYVLSAALAGWIAREDGMQIRARAARAYNQYQKCGIKAATNLFATGR